MCESDLIDVESMDLSDDQTWLYKWPEDSGQRVDMVDWGLSLDWPVYTDVDYVKTEKQLQSMLDEILKNQVQAMPDKHKFDSRTYVKPKKRPTRPSIQAIVETATPSMSPNVSLNNSSNKYLTYNKYMPLGPMLRLKTFNVEANTENSSAVKDYAMKRRSVCQDDDPQLEDVDMTLCSETSERLSSEHRPSKPINIDLSQPAHNIHSTFNKSMFMSEGPAMYQSGESLTRMSPPSLVSSLLMDNSGTFNPESLEGKSLRDSGLPSGRDSIDPMMTSMTLSILDEKDMSTSFLSQSTYPDHDSLMDSLPPSLVSSVNSSYVVSQSRQTDSTASPNIFSSATFTNFSQQEKLLSYRPRHQMYNSFTKRETPMRNSESYTKAKEEACQIDTTKVLNENMDKRDSTPKPESDMSETVTLHYSNNKFRRNDAEKENLNSSFKNDDAFYKDMGMQRTVNLERNSLNVTLDKQELNEIIQARQKLSLARKALPTAEPDNLPNQVESPAKRDSPLSHLVAKKSIENASELLARRRATNGTDRIEEQLREPPKRNATFKKVSPRANSMDTTIVFLKDEKQIIDINSATLNLIDTNDRTLQQEEWNSQERAMVGSSESTDTATCSSASPPGSVPDATPPADPRLQIASTPLAGGRKSDLLDLHSTISPIYQAVDDKSYTVTTASPVGDSYNATVINTATMVKRGPKRDVVSAKSNPERKPGLRSPLRIPNAPVTNNAKAPTTMGPKKTGLPTSKLRQYSSHRELRIPVSSNGPAPLRRAIYASNPALAAPAPPARRDSYTIAVDPHHVRNEEQPAKPVLTNPPALVRQGTETLRRERPQSQLVQPKEHRALVQPTVVYYQPATRNSYMVPPVSRPYSVASAGPLRVARPATAQSMQRQLAVAVAPAPEPRAAAAEARASALPRPSRLPAPRRALRPTSVYSAAPTADLEHY